MIPTSSAKWLSSISKRKIPSKSTDKRPDEPKKDLKTLRKEKLEQLAEKEKKEKAKKEEEAKPRQPVQTKPKIKQSLPKVAKMLQPLESAPKQPATQTRAFERALSMQDIQPLKKVMEDEYC